MSKVKFHLFSSSNVFAVLTALLSMMLVSSISRAQDIPYHPSVTLRVGQSIVLKGVRNSNCGTKVPKWANISKRLPKSKLGKFSDGGPGTVRSDHCFNTFDIFYVPARGVRFTAQKRGTEKLKIFRDPVSIVVK